MRRDSGGDGAADAVDAERVGPAGRARWAVGHDDDLVALVTAADAEQGGLHLPHHVVGMHDWRAQGSMMRSECGQDLRLAGHALRLSAYGLSLVLAGGNWS